MNEMTDGEEIRKINGYFREWNLPGSVESMSQETVTIQWQHHPYVVNRKKLQEEMKKSKAGLYILTCTRKERSLATITDRDLLLLL